MSILYRLFGIPRTLDEFIEKVKRKGIAQVDVTVGFYNPNGMPNQLLARSVFCDHCFVISLSAGKTRLKLSEHEQKYIPNDLGRSIIAMREAEKEMFEEAIRIAEKLSGMGLEVTICGEPISESRKTVEERIKKIEEMKKKFKISEPLPEALNT